VAAEAMGVDTVGWKVRAFVISAAFAGLAGGSSSTRSSSCTPRMFTFVKSDGGGGDGGARRNGLHHRVDRGGHRAHAWRSNGCAALDQYRMVVSRLLLVALMLTPAGSCFGTRESGTWLPRWMGGRRPAGRAA